MSIDPAIARMYAENVRAKVIPKAHPTKLAPALVQKIRERVPVFKGMPWIASAARCCWVST